MEKEGDAEFDFAVVLGHALEDLVAQLVDGTELGELRLAATALQDLFVSCEVAVDLPQELADQLRHAHLFKEFLPLNQRTV